jgi:hypothetical protein
MRAVAKADSVPILVSQIFVSRIFASAAFAGDQR